MLGNNQEIKIQPGSINNIVISLTTYNESGAILITRHVKFDKDPKKYLMAIEAAIIYLEKKTENAEF